MGWMSRQSVDDGRGGRGKVRGARGCRCLRRVRGVLRLVIEWLLMLQML